MLAETLTNSDLLWILVVILLVLLIVYIVRRI